MASWLEWLLSSSGDSGTSIDTDSVDFWLIPDLVTDRRSSQMVAVLPGSRDLTHAAMRISTSDSRVASDGASKAVWDDASATSGYRSHPVEPIAEQKNKTGMVLHHCALNNQQSTTLDQRSTNQEKDVMQSSGALDDRFCQSIRAYAVESTISNGNQAASADQTEQLEGAGARQAEPRNCHRLQDMQLLASQGGTSGSAYKGTEIEQTDTSQTSSTSGTMPFLPCDDLSVSGDMTTTTIIDHDLIWSLRPYRSAVDQLQAMQAVPEPASVLFRIYWWKMIHELEREICDSTPGGNAGDGAAQAASRLQ